MEVMPVYAPSNPVTLYNHDGECVGRWVPETGRGMIGDCFVVKECVGKMVWIKGGSEFEVYRFTCCGNEWSEARCVKGQSILPGDWCPFCGAKVVE